MTYYDMSNCTAVEGFADFLRCPNSISGGGFWMITWLAVYLATFMIIKGMRMYNQEAFAGASVLGFFFALFLWWLKLVNWQIMLGATVLMIIAGIWVTVSNQSET